MRIIDPLIVEDTSKPLGHVAIPYNQRMEFVSVESSALDSLRVGFSNSDIMTSETDHVAFMRYKPLNHNA